MHDGLSVALYKSKSCACHSHAHVRLFEELFELQSVLESLAIVTRFNPDAHHDAVAHGGLLRRIGSARIGLRWRVWRERRF